MRENDSGWKVIYMDNAQGPEKANDICVRTMRAGTFDRGLTVHVSVTFLAFKIN
jgi:hypothetical protein